MKTHRQPGPLIIIGGAEDRTGPCTILREFLRLSGGVKARIVVLTVASEHPREVGAEYLECLQRLGAKQVQVMDVREREQAHAAELIEAVSQATGVFFTGGDQLRVTNLLGGTPSDQMLHRRHEEGLVLAGTSAGAAMMASTMIVQGHSEATPRLGIVRVGPGMEFMHGTIIDQHFAQRGRGGRLLTALAQYPHQLGLGIDEDTALIVAGEEFAVIGSGAVVVFDAGNTSYNDVLERHERERLAICDVRLHVLTTGFRFNLAQRRPIPPDRPSSARRTEDKHHEA
jgi:cyanophycinase